jgi:hypothetical protein
MSSDQRLLGTFCQSLCRSEGYYLQSNRIAHRTIDPLNIVPLYNL